MLTILCVVIGPYLYRVQRQRAAVKWVIENGGQVTYDIKTNEIFSLPRRPKQSGLRKWVAETFGVDCVSSVTQVRFVSSRQKDIRDFSPLNGLRDLEQLWIFNVEFSELGQLAQLKSLRRISINNTQLNDLQALILR